MSTSMAGSFHTSNAINDLDIQNSISEIFDLERDSRAPFGIVPGYQENDHNTGSERIDERITAKVEYLTHILPILTHLWLSSSEHLDLAAEKLADAGRESE